MSKTGKNLKNRYDSRLVMQVFFQVLPRVCFDGYMYLEAFRSIHTHTIIPVVRSSKPAQAFVGNKTLGVRFQPSSVMLYAVSFYKCFHTFATSLPIYLASMHIYTNFHLRGFLTPFYNMVSPFYNGCMEFVPLFITFSIFYDMHTAVRTH